MQSLNEIRLDIVRSQIPYYVYFLYSPDGKPFYVGKGKSDRIEAHEQEARYFMRNKKWKGLNEYKIKTIIDIWSNSQSVSYAIDSWHQDSASAGEREREIIDKLGKKVNGTGILTNILDGGDYLTEEDRIGISNKLKQFCSENPDFIKNLQEKKKEWIENHPEEYAEAERKRLDICANEEVRKAVSETLKEYYKKNPEALKEMSKRSKAQFASEEAREVVSQNSIKNKSHEHILKWLEEVDDETLVEKGRNHSEWMRNFFQTEDGKAKAKQAAEKRNTKFRTDEHRQHMAEKTRDHIKNNPESWKKRCQKVSDLWKKRKEEQQLNWLLLQEQLYSEGKIKNKFEVVKNYNVYNWKKKGLVTFVDGVWLLVNNTMV